MELKWNENYSVGDEIIDLQHKMLFTIINDLERYIIEEKAIDYIEETLERMSVYATMHFRTEEDLLFKADYNEFQIHKALHDDFKKKIIKATNTLLNDQSMKTVIDIHRYLHSWVTSHILEEDVKYRAYIG